MTLARVGLPGGLAFQTWQLEELRDKKLIYFYETRERECCYTVCKPVHYTKTIKVCSGHWETRDVECCAPAACEPSCCQPQCCEPNCCQPNRPKS